MFQLNEVKLGDIVEEISMGPFGSDIKTDNYVPSGVPIIRGGNLTSGRFNPDAGFVYLTKEKADSLGKANAYPDDILITHRGTLGQVGIIPRGEYDRYVVSQSLLRLKLKTKQANPFYIYYFLKSPAGQYRILANTSQTGVPAISQPVTSIRAIPIPLPPLPVQQRIADILGTLDDKIELNRRMNATLEAMARALFKSWFVDFDPVHAKAAGQPTGLPAHIDALFPSTFVDSPLGQIPQGWGVGKVGDVVQCVGGSTPSTTEKSFWENGNYNWATPKDLSHLSNSFLLTTDRKITQQGLAKISSGLLPVDTLLMSSRAPVGYLALATIPVAINQGFIGILSNEYFHSTYMLNWCQFNMSEITNRATGTTFAEISKSSFRDINLIIPPQLAILEFTKSIDNIYQQVVSNLQQIDTLTILRDTLLPKLLSGEVEVMNYDPAKHHRRSIRLKDYDYTQAGAYFVTLCTQHRACVLGDVIEREVRLSAAGAIVAEAWEWLAQQYPYVSIDEYVVMPNHFHGIIVIDDGHMHVGAVREPPNAPTMIPRKPLGRLIGAFKTVSTKHINVMNATPGIAFWQRNYYEHIIRHPDALNRIRRYIIHNPLKWSLDRENPLSRR